MQRDVAVASACNPLASVTQPGNLSALGSFMVLRIDTISLCTFNITSTDFHGRKLAAVSVVKWVACAAPRMTTDLSRDALWRVDEYTVQRPPSFLWP
jgi:hypothetical protein